jgi:hypothetical protein
MSKILDSQLVLKALSAVGQALSRRGRVVPIRVLVAGGTAGILGGLLRPERTTGDCDVMEVGIESDWSDLERAAAETATQLDLPPTWLNRDCQMYAWCLPVGWQSRCEPVDRFGPLDVSRVSRIDLIAAKVIGGPTRPQDLEDLRDLQPDMDELDFAEQNLDRLEAEHLDGRKFDNERAILNVLRGER